MMAPKFCIFSLLVVVHTPQTTATKMCFDYYFLLFLSVSITACTPLARS